jgi:hypothetical protein
MLETDIEKEIWKDIDLIDFNQQVYKQALEISMRNEFLRLKKLRIFKKRLQLIKELIR